MPEIVAATRVPRQGSQAKSNSKTSANRKKNSSNSLASPPESSGLRHNIDEVMSDSGPKSVSELSLLEILQVQNPQQNSRQLGAGFSIQQSSYDRKKNPNDLSKLYNTPNNLSPPRKK